MRPDLDDPLDPFYDPADTDIDAHADTDSEADADETDLDAMVGPMLGEISFSELRMAAATGFSAQQARAALASPRALRHLDVLLSLGGPSRAILDAARGTGPAADRHRELIAAVAGPAARVDDVGRADPSAAVRPAGAGVPDAEATVGDPVRLAGTRTPAARRVGMALVAACVAALVLVAGFLAVRLDVRPEPPPVVGSTGPSPTAEAVQALPRSSTPLPETTAIQPRAGKDLLTQLYLIDTAGEVIRGLGGPPTHRLFAPSLSRDRRTLIYIDETANQLRTMAVDGTGDRLLFPYPLPDCGTIGHAAWDPADQNLLVLQCQPESKSSRLMLITLAGQLVRTLPTGSGSVDDPSVSPDGTTVVYWATERANAMGGGSLYTIALNGTGQPVRLTYSAEGIDADPAYSPDGSLIAFRRRDAASNEDVWVMSTTGADARPLVGGPSRDRKPAWSSDGSQLLFISDRDGEGKRGATMDLFVVHVDGTGLRRLGVPSHEMLTPVWSRR